MSHPLTDVIRNAGIYVSEDENLPLVNGRTRVEWAVFGSRPVWSPRIIDGKEYVTTNARPVGGAAMEADDVARIAFPIGDMPDDIARAIRAAGWSVAEPLTTFADYR